VREAEPQQLAAGPAMSPPTTGGDGGCASPTGFRLDGVVVPGDVLFVKGTGGFMELGTAGGFLGHVMLVIEAPERISANSELAQFLEPIWPTDGAKEIWKLRTAEATRSNEGLHECDLLMRIDCDTHQLVLIGEFGNGQVDFCNEVVDLWQCPRQLRAQLHTRLVESVIREMQLQGRSWSWTTAARAVLRNPECLTDCGDKEQLLREIIECWAADPICTSVVICFWQRCLVQLADAANSCSPNGVPQVEPVDLILKWMPLKADRSLPGILLETMRRCGWTRRTTLRVGDSRNNNWGDVEQVVVFGQAPAPPQSAAATPAPPQPPPRPPPPQAVQPPGPVRTHSGPQQSPVAPRYCSSHNSSGKRAKCAAHPRQCASCKTEVQTTYAEFALCPPCSERRQCCMICGTKSEQRGDYVPPSRLDAHAPCPEHAAGRVKVEYHPERRAGTEKDASPHRVGASAGGALPADVAPLAMLPPMVPPRYCQAHNASEKRAKTTAQYRECPCCNVVVSTTYASFAMCPPCSERHQKCMICGVGAPDAGNYLPAAQFATVREENHAAEVPPQAPSPAPSSAPSPSLTKGGPPPRYCSAHDTRRKRAKVEARLLECAGCRTRIMTNTAEFTFCPSCSERSEKCMICGSHASGAVPAAELPQISEESVLHGAAPAAATVPPVYCGAHDARSKRPKGPSRFRECSACRMLIQTNCVDFSLCPSCSQHKQQCMICGAGAGVPGHLPGAPAPGALENTMSAFDMSQAEAQEPPVLPRGPPADMSQLEASQMTESYVPATPSQTRPRYCRAHDSKDRRPKVRARLKACKLCKHEVNTNCADFALCPSCSQRHHQCMLCAAPAPDSDSPDADLAAGSPMKPPPPPPPVAFSEEAAAAAQELAVPGPCVRRYCPAHEARERRLKVEPWLGQCRSCLVRVQTNCAEFSLCQGCSESRHRCMICAASVAPEGHAAPPQPGLDGRAAGQLAQEQLETPFPNDNMMRVPLPMTPDVPLAFLAAA